MIIIRYSNNVYPVLPRWGIPGYDPHEPPYLNQCEGYPGSIRQERNHVVRLVLLNNVDEPMGVGELVHGITKDPMDP